MNDSFLNSILSQNNGVVLTVKVKPQSRKNKIEVKDYIKIYVTEIPEKGKANEAVIRFLATTLNIRYSDFEIVSGYKSSIKRIFIKNFSKNEIVQKLRSFT